MAQNLHGSTPYDDVFRTLSVRCPELLVPVINEIFGTDYGAGEEIVLLQNEHFTLNADGSEQERISDGSILIGRDRRHYHLECQSTWDGSILIRIFEYGAQIGIEDAECGPQELTVTLPESAVIYLRRNPGTAEKLKIRIVTPDGEAAYYVKTFRLEEYALDALKEKNLLFFIPFFLFTHERELAGIDCDPERLQALMGEYHELKGWLEEQRQEEKIDEFTRRLILEMTQKVTGALAGKHGNIRKGVSRIMGGKVLKTEATSILDRGIEIGIEQGIEKGIEQGIAFFIRDKKEDGAADTVILQKLAKGYGLSEEQAEAYLKKYGA